MRFWIRLGVVLSIAALCSIIWLAHDHRQYEHRLAVSVWQDSIRGGVEAAGENAAKEWEALVAGGMSPGEATAESRRRHPQLLSGDTALSVDAVVYDRIASSTPPRRRPLPSGAILLAWLIPTMLYAGVGWAIDALFQRT
jgi:hypothetical protein